MNEKTEKRFLKASNFEGYLEEVTCPICSPPPDPIKIYETTDGIGIWECPDCSILYASPRFDEPSLHKIYDNEFFFDKSKFDNWTIDKWKNSGGRDYIVPHLKVNLVKQFINDQSRVLDVGCSTGEFCLAANMNGLNCEGIDVSKMLSDIARDVLKLPIHHKKLEDFYPETPYKAVVIWDVLEHLYDPIETLKACNRILEPGGYLFAQVPNLAGLSNRFKSIKCRSGIKDNNYGHFGFPWHLFSFNKRSLSKMMKTVDFQPLHFESWSHLYKDGHSGVCNNLMISTIKKYCLSDYIIIVAQKIK